MDADRPGRPAGHLPSVVYGGINLIRSRLKPGEQSRTRCGQANAPGRAVEELDADPGLQLLNRLAQGRAGYLEFPGRGREAAASGDAGKGSERVEFKSPHAP